MPNPKDSHRPHKGVLRAAKVLGGKKELANALDVAPPTVSQWISRKRPVPIPRCPMIEAATGGKVRCWDLRPLDWYLIWPERIGTDGAPPVLKEAA